MSVTGYYTGVGSRSTPDDILGLMEQTARALSEDGWVLRSGGADGADTAFESGASQSNIFIPWPGFKDYEDPAREKPAARAYTIVSDVHPAWYKLSNPAQKLHARNAHQVLGEDLETPSSFLICWTPDGAGCIEDCSEDTGGTATAIRLADRLDIPIKNLANPSARASVKDYCGDDWSPSPG